MVAAPSRSFQRTALALLLCAAIVFGGVRVQAHAPSPIAAFTVQGSAKVWVNQTSNVYHCPGSSYYGATKRGAYMSEGEARESGNRPAYGQVCGPLSEAKPSSALPLGEARPGSETHVWVNTSSGVYHCAGSQYYKKTKRGKLMTEREAKASGKRPAYGKTCS